MGSENIRMVDEIEDLLLTPLKKIRVNGGDIFHALKKTDCGFSGFGEAYFSTINPLAVKAWKRHRSMTLNLVVPFGKVRFVICDDRKNHGHKRNIQEVILSRDQYFRLTIPPMLWVGFQGCSSSTSIVLNVADMEHHPDEVDRMDISEINFNWGC